MKIFASVVVSIGFTVAAFADDAVSLKLLSTLKTGNFDEGAAEIVDYDPGTKRAFVVNGEKGNITIVDLSDPSKISAAKEIAVSEYGKEFTCVAVHGNLVALTAVPADKQSPGKLVVMDTDGAVLQTFPTGALPDNVGISPDGRFIVTANEGEPNDDYNNDPEGSVTVVEVAENVADSTVTQITFGEITEVPESVRIFGKKASIAQDLEPEFVCISGDSKTAYIMCQENNGALIIDLPSKSIKGLVGLGFKDHNEAGNGFDASNKTDEVMIKTWPVLGMYQPDSAVAAVINDKTFIFTANEGDARDYDGFSEEERVEDLKLDAEAYPNAAELQDVKQLGRLKTTSATGDTDGDGDIDQIYSYGARSFAIWDDEMTLVWESGDMIERITSERLGKGFNATNDESPSFKNRSDDKGPEPEAIAVGTIGGRTFCFVGLERVGGVMVFDVSDPSAPTFAGYENNRNFAVEFDEDNPDGAADAGDLGPEAIVFIPAAESPNGKDLIVVSNEVSGTVSVFEVGVN